MARGRKPKTLTEVEQINAEIEEHEFQLKELKLKKKAIEVEQVLTQYGDLIEIITESGLSKTELKKILTKGIAESKREKEAKKTTRKRRGRKPKAVKAEEVKVEDVKVEEVEKTAGSTQDITDEIMNDIE